MANGVVKVSQAEGEKLLQMQREREEAMQRRSSSGSEDEKVEINQGPSETQPHGPLKQSLLDRTKGVATSIKNVLTESTPEQRKAIREAELETKFNKKMAIAKGEAVEEAPSKDSKSSRDSEPSSSKKSRDSEPSSSKKKSKRGKRKRLDDLFDEMDDEDDEFGSSRKRRDSKDSPVGSYKSAYHHNKPVPYESAFLPNKPTAYQEAYTGKKLVDNGVYKSPGNPKTYDMSRGEPQQAAPRPPQPTPQPMIQRARSPPMPMPTIGSFNGNIKMPTISLGGTPRMGSAHKPGAPGNMPSINIPTLGGSTLLPGMGRGAKMGGGNFNIPTIGNWGKAPLKSKLETPNIGNLTIMGAGKGAVKFGLGEIPRFGLAAAPVKRKK